jgi:hypothetical protein
MSFTDRAGRRIGRGELPGDPLLGFAFIAFIALRFVESGFNAEGILRIFFQE